MTKFSALAAPALMLFYGLCRMVDGFDGDRGDGVAWDVGHIAFFWAMVLFAVLAVRLRRAVDGPRLLMDAATGAALFGAGCFLWVIAGDLSDRFREAAPLPALLELGGPVLFQLGMLTLMVRLVQLRRLPAWSPALVLLGFVAVAVNLDLLPVGALLVGAGLLPVAIRLPRTAGTPAAARR